MNNLFFKDEDNGKKFRAMSFGGNEVTGELFHCNGDHFIMVDGLYAVNVVPSTVKEVTSEEQPTLAQTIRVETENSINKRIQEIYDSAITEIKSRAASGYDSASITCPKTIVRNVSNLLVHDGFTCKYAIEFADSSIIHINW